MDLTYKYHDFITGYGLTSNFTPNWVWSYNDKPHFFDGHNHYHLESNVKPHSSPIYNRSGLLLTDSR